MCVLQSLAQLEILCKQLYETTDTSTRLQAEKALVEFTNSPDCLSKCQLLLERGSVSSALLLQHSTFSSPFTFFSLSPLTLFLFYISSFSPFTLFSFYFFSFSLSTSPSSTGSTSPSSSCSTSPSASSTSSCSTPPFISFFLSFCSSSLSPPSMLLFLHLLHLFLFHLLLLFFSFPSFTFSSSFFSSFRFSSSITVCLPLVQFLSLLPPFLVNVPPVGLIRDYLCFPSTFPSFLPILPSIISPSFCCEKCTTGSLQVTDQY